MQRTTTILLLIFSLSTSYVQAQKSASADSVKSKKEVQRVNNTTPVTKMIIPKLDPKPVLVSSVTQTMSKGENPGIQLDIPEVTVEDIQRDLEKRIKSKTKSKFVKSGNETSIEQTTIKEISDAPLNVFVQVTPLDSGTRVTTYIEDQGKFIGEAEGDKYAKMKTFVRDFGIDAYKEEVSGQVSIQEKVLKDLEGSLDKLKKQNEKMHADIKENEANIVNSEVDIKANARQQELKDEEILQQRSVVNATSDKEARKVEDKKLNSLEKEKNNLRGDINSLNKKIVKSRADIEELEDEIEVNLQEQELLKEKITEQRALVKALEGKLERIK